MGPLPAGEGPLPCFLPRAGHGCQHKVSALTDGANTRLLESFSCRELLLEGSPMSQEELSSTLSSIPSQLSAEDIEDFFSLAQYYASRTPQSFRKVGL